MVTLRVAWYRFRATFSRRRRGLLSLVLLIGLIGGVAIESMAAARRTASSFSVYLTSTNPSDLSVEIIPGNGWYSAAITKKIATLAHVKAVKAASLGLLLIPLTASDRPRSPRPTRTRSTVPR